MDTDDDMHDYYDSDDDMGSESYGDDVDDGDYAHAKDDSDAETHSKQNFTILSEANVRQLQEEDITELSNVLSVSRSDACILLRHHNWDSSKVHEEWFTDEAKVRKVVGLLENTPIMLNTAEVNCGICFETYPHHETSSASCGHRFCQECWRGYIHNSVNDGPGCLMLRCPDPSCIAAVSQDMVNLLACDEDKEKYFRYLLRSYIEDNVKRKWCPAPGCDFAVTFDVGNSNSDVSCGSMHTFCWNCTEDAHRPVPCDTVSKWVLKNSAESENMNWILANSKSCPKCKRPIEKNHGCMHMTCTPPCKFEFCWLCLGAWSEHGKKTGGFYACNHYEAARKDGEFDEAEKRRERAKSSLERYMHYYERWANNQSSRQKAQADLLSMQTDKLEKLREKLGRPEVEFTFVTEAWEQIVECRRVLKWTYAYGYYLPEQEVAKRHFFEYLQGEAESGLERLHKYAEKELQVFFEAKDPSENLGEFHAVRTHLVGLTTVTRTYFENLVRALESGLKEVNAPKFQQDDSSGSNGSKGKGKAPGTSRGSFTYKDEDGEFWHCNRCTYRNRCSVTSCLICGQHDDDEEKDSE